MRIIRQSTLADGSPYLHLGYTSALVFTPDRGLYTAGGIVTAMGAFLLLVGIARIGMAKAGLLPRQKYAAAIVGLLMCACGGLCFYLAERYGSGKAQSPFMYTHSRMRAISMKLLDMPEAERATVTGLGQVPGAAAYTLDGWRHDIRLERKDGKPWLRSAGADGQYDTGDDLAVDLLPVFSYHKAGAVTQPTTSRVVGRQIEQ